MPIPGLWRCLGVSFNESPSPPPELPGFIVTTIPSVDPNARPCLSRVCQLTTRDHRWDFPVLRLVPCLHAVAIPLRVLMECCSLVDSLASAFPRYRGGSAPCVNGFEARLTVPSRYGLHARIAFATLFTQRPFSISLPPLLL